MKLVKYPLARQWGSRAHAAAGRLGGGYELQLRKNMVEARAGREISKNHGEKDTSLRKKAKLLIHELRAFYSHDRFSFLSLQTNHGSLEVSALAAETEGREWRRRSRRAAKLPDPADEANEAEISPRSMLWMRICQNLSRRRRRRRRHEKEGRQLGTEIDAHEDIERNRHRPH